MADSNDAYTAKLALEEIWRPFALRVEEAKAHEQELAHDPSLLSDPRISAETRWVQIFDREINDVQTIHESVESGSRVSAQAIRSATGAAEKLLRIVDEAVSRVRTPEAIS